MKAKVIWTVPAREELAGIYQYLLDNTSVRTAKSIIEDMLDISQLEQFPQSGAIDHNLEDEDEEIRFILKGQNRYKLIYLIRECTVYILDVFDCRIDPSKIKRHIKR